VEGLREKIATGQSKIFRAGFYITIYGGSLDELKNRVSFVEKMLAELMVYSKRSILQAKEGFNSTLPTCQDQLSIGRNLDTASLSTFFPFLSDTLTQDEGVFYGINKINNSLIVFDRFSLPNYNSVIIAMSGAGKSYTVKLELIRSLILGAEIFVIDPENEYEMLCNAFSGAYINININSEQHINPFDLPQTQDPKEAVEALRSNTLMLAGLIKIMIGTITPLESNILDNAIIECYASRGITDDPSTHSIEPPTFHDLQQVLESINGGETMAVRLSKFTDGTYSGLLNQHTNISTNNKLVVFCIRDLEEELRPIAMYMTLNFIWNTIKGDIKKRLLFVDEAWILMKYPESAQFLFSVAKRGRKYFLGLTCIAQDAADFFSSDYGRAIVQNSSMSILLRQHPAQVDFVKEAFQLTETERNYLVSAGVGEGLFIAGLRHAAIQIIPSYQEDLLCNTKPAGAGEENGEV
jgi:conjugal transfer ATP-binding protein TraC